MMRFDKVIVEQTNSFLRRLVQSSTQKVGLPPGTVVHVGKKRVDSVLFRLCEYSSKTIVVASEKVLEKVFPFKKSGSINWLDVTGIHDVEVIRKIGDELGLHLLVQEDIANTGKRPSLDDAKEYLFFAIKMLYVNKRGEISSEHVSILIGKNYLVSFQEREGDVFEGVRKRIADKRRIISRGSDYLGYSLIDAIVDNYFIVLDKFSEQIAELDDEVTKSPTQQTLLKINNLKRELIFMRKQVWPLRDVLSKFKKSESPLISPETLMYVDDVYDHTVQIIDTLESYRDIISGMTDLYMSSVSNRMNEIMKFLTIFSSIFIPLTFIAGIYGMNFENMPELTMQYGYFVVLGVFVLIVLSLLWYFKKKGWFTV